MHIIHLAFTPVAQLITTMEIDITTPELVSIADGISYYAINKAEAEFIYKEIFLDHCYDVISEPPATPFIIDAGANIGLFSLYMKHKYPSARILAFEPAPACYDALSRNLSLHGCLPSVKALQCGLSSAPGTLPLTYFPNFPGNSTLFPREKEQLREWIVRRFGREAADELFGGAVLVDVELRRLSDVLREEEEGGDKMIDLLKVDVEGAELQVLEGVDDEHWALVRNVVVETWEPSGIRPRIESLLEGKGFMVTHDQAEWAPDQFSMITARRG